MRWCFSHRADTAAAQLADRHYNRQKIGSPQFVPPGRCLVLLSDDARAFWITSWPFAEYVKHRWAGAWVCSAFRNEGCDKASSLISEALACSRYYFGDPPALGLVTFIDRDKVRPTMVRGVPTWGYSYRKAGFFFDGETKGGLLAFRILPQDIPSAEPYKPRNIHGLPLFAKPAVQPV